MNEIIENHHRNLEFDRQKLQSSSTKLFLSEIPQKELNKMKIVIESSSEYFFILRSYNSIETDRPNLIKSDQMLVRIGLEDSIFKQIQSEVRNKKRRQNNVTHKNSSKNSKTELINILDFDLFLNTLYTEEVEETKEEIPQKIKQKKVACPVKQEKILNKRKISVESKLDTKSMKKQLNGLYDLDNFVIHSTSKKILEKKQILKVFTPNFKELNSNFFYPDEEESLIKKSKEFEDTSDDSYLKYHNECELKEKEFRINFFKKKDKKSEPMKKIDYDEHNEVSKFENNLESK